MQVSGGHPHCIINLDLYSISKPNKITDFTKLDYCEIVLLSVTGTHLGWSDRFYISLGKSNMTKDGFKNNGQINLLEKIQDTITFKSNNYF